MKKYDTNLKEWQQCIRWEGFNRLQVVRIVKIIKLLIESKIFKRGCYKQWILIQEIKIFKFKIIFAVHLLKQIQLFMIMII